MFVCYMPKVITGDDNMKLRNRPWFIEVKLSRGSEFVGVHSVPTIHEVVGFASHSGPPGFGFWERQSEVLESRFFTVVRPNVAFDTEVFDVVDFAPRGMLVWQGALALAVEIFAPDSFLSQMRQEVAEGRWFQPETHRYELPAILR